MGADEPRANFWPDEQKPHRRSLIRDNLNNAYRRVKAYKGAPGADGMTMEAALPWLKEHGKELTESIRQGRYKIQLASLSPSAA